MSDQPEKEQNDISKFIHESIESIKQGTKDTGMILDGQIEFELTVAVRKGAGGKFQIFVAEAGGKIEKEHVSKIKFSVRKLFPLAGVGKIHD